MHGRCVPDQNTSLLHQALAKREQAARARRLATGVTAADVLRSLNDYATKLENEAFALEQQAAEMKRTVERSRQLAQEVGDLSQEARKRLAQLKATIDKK
jgi:hypothetical protein